jgi:hypothetical protein
VGDDTWPAEAWSLVVEFDGDSKGVGTEHAKVCFRVEDAPSWRLKDGATFSLQEGYNASATGVIVDPPGDRARAKSICPCNDSDPGLTPRRDVCTAVRPTVLPGRDAP